MPRPALAAPAGEAFGASVNRLFNDMTDTPAQISAQLSALRATGATLARSDALWEATEPSAPVDGVHRWVWTFDDTIAGDLAAAGLSWLPILDYTAPWAQSVPGQDHSPPRAVADYAAYARAFTARYGAGGTFWRGHPQLIARPVTAIEIWNEPDNPEFWNPQPDAAGYARLYATAREAIDDADPSVRVIVGGLVNPAAFLPAMLRADPGLAGHLDGVAIHPYGTPAVVLAKVRGARRALHGLGMDAVPLYVTEVGWTTSPPGALDYVAAPRRPAWIERTLAALQPPALRAGGHRALHLGDAATRPGRQPGLVRDPRPDDTATPSSDAFAAAVRAAAAPSAPLPC